eukprot:m.356113 g.356113  ORF g.356113 m.356113 type:complete len:239 (+) comp17443_c0_seq1:265-981(+)
MIGTLLGCVFITYALPVALFWYIVSGSPKLVIVCVSGAFMWLLAALLSSLMWLAVVPLKQDFWFVLIFSTFFQELFRYLWWKLLHKAEKGLSILAKDGSVHLTREKMALVSGLGFGLMAGTFVVCNQFEPMGGPGMLPAPGCPSHSIYVVSALQAGLLILTHTCWGVLAHAGWYERCEGKGVFALSNWKIVFVWATHYAVSFLSLKTQDSCATGIIPLAIVLMVSATSAWMVAGARFS